MSLSFARWRQVTFAGGAALVPGAGVVQVAADGGTAAARRGAGGAAGPDQVSQLAAGVVAGLGVGMVAQTAGHRGQRSLQQAGRPARGSGARRRVPAGQAAVCGGGTVGVEGGEAPAGAGVAGRGGGQVAGVVAVQGAEPVGFAGGLGAALPGGQRDGEGDQRGQARPGRRPRTGSGAFAPAAGAADRAAGTVARSARTMAPLSTLFDQCFEIIDSCCSAWNLRGTLIGLDS